MAPATSKSASNRSETVERLLGELWYLDRNRLEQSSALRLQLPAFIKLLDNYKFRTNETEYQSGQHLSEIWQFLDAIMRTKVMERTHQFLIDQKLAPVSLEEFKGQLYEMWFQFRRPREFNLFSHGEGQFSPFEHIFVGELDGKTLRGFHNWIQLFRYELEGLVTVKKYSRKSCSKKPHFLSVHLSAPQWNVTKRGAYVMMGTSPEFELAAYTLVFLMNTAGKLSVNGCTIYLVCTHQIFDPVRPYTCFPKNGFL